MLDKSISTSGFVSTICQHTGRQCRSATRLARDLEQANVTARTFSPVFELAGVTRLAGCHETCMGIFRLSLDGVQLFCGVEPDAGLDELSAFASQFLETDAGELASMPCDPPLAFATTISARHQPELHIRAEAS